MSAPQSDAHWVVDPLTGEMVPVGELTITWINTQLVQLNRALADMEKPMRELLTEQQKVNLRYDLEYSAAVLASTQRSEDRRKADAMQHVATMRLDDSEESLAARKSVLEMRVRAMRDAGHDLRARMTTLQSIASNLRTQAQIERYTP